MKRVLAPLVLITLVALSLTAAAASHPGGPEPLDSEILEDAIEWWQDTHTEPGCDPAKTDWGAIALTAAGHDPHEGDPSPADRVDQCDPGTDADTADLARHVLAIEAIGDDASDHNGTDWTQELETRWTGTQFTTNGNPMLVNDDIFALLALRAHGHPPDHALVQGAGNHIANNQNGDGGWSHTTTGPTTTSDTDMTSAALEALTSANQLDEADPQDALDYLADRAHLQAGCMAQSATNDDPNTSSTAWALLGILATHNDPRADDWTSHESPWDCLRAAQTPPGGFATRPGQDNADWMATRDALLALSAIPHGRLNVTHQAPTATLDTSSSPTEGEETTLQAHGIPHASWMHEDGTLHEGTNPPWTPTQPGETTFHVLITDAHGTTRPRTYTTTVDPAPNDPPSSGPSPPEPDPQGPTVHAPQATTAERAVETTLTLDATPHDAPVVQFKLDWDDGNTTDWQPSSTFTHTYHDLGEHNLTAWAKDAQGDIGETHAPLTVRPADPRLEIDAPPAANRTESIPLHAHATDPDGPPPTIEWTLPHGNQTGPNATARLDEPGNHTLSATATDQDGNQATAHATIRALNRPPTNLTIDRLTVPANTTIVLHATATDPDEDPLDYAWTIPDHDEPPTRGAQRHIETGPPDTWTLHVNATDPHGAWIRANATLHIQDHDDPTPPEEPTPRLEIATSPHDPAPRSTSPEDPRRPPTVTLPEHITARANTTTLLQGTATDPNQTPRHVIVELGGPLPVDGTDPFTALVPELPPGTYTITAKALDATGTAGPPTNTTLTVHDPPQPLTEHNETPPPPTDGTDETPLSLLAILASLLLATAKGGPRP